MKNKALTISILALGIILNNNNTKAAEGKTAGESEQIKALREEMKGLKDMFAQFMAMSVGKEKAAGSEAKAAAPGAGGMMYGRGRHGRGHGCAGGRCAVKSPEQIELERLILAYIDTEKDLVKNFQQGISLRRLIDRLKQLTSKSEKEIIAALKSDGKTEKDFIKNLLTISPDEFRKGLGRAGGFGGWARRWRRG